MRCSCANNSRYGRRAGEPSSWSTSQITATGGRPPGETREVDRSFGVPAAFEHATVLRAQREDVTGPDEVVGTRRGIEEPLDRERAIAGTDARPRVAVIDRHRERGVATGAAGRDHRLDVELVEPRPAARHADEPARPTQHEVDGLRRDPLGGQGEVALVLPVFVVNYENHLAAANPAQRVVDRRQ